MCIVYQNFVLLNTESRKYFKASELILTYLPVRKILLSAIQIKNEKQIAVIESDFTWGVMLKISHEQNVTDFLIIIDHKFLTQKVTFLWTTYDG